MRKRIAEIDRQYILHLAAEGFTRGEILEKVKEQGVKIALGTISNILYMSRYGRSTTTRPSFYTERGCRHDTSKCECVNLGKRSMNEYYREAGYRISQPSVVGGGV